MWKPLAIQLLAVVATTASAFAQEPAAPEPGREGPAEVGADEPVVDAAVAALLPGQVESGAAGSAATPDPAAEDLAAMLRDYAGCEIIADVLLMDLIQPAEDRVSVKPADETP